MSESLPETRVWFNKSLSSLHGVLRQLRAGWGEGLFLIGSHTDLDFAPLLECDQAELEPSGLSSEAYVGWCLDFCRKHRVDVFIPGRRRAAIADRRADFEACGTRLIVAGDGPTLRLLEDKGRFLEQVPPGVPVHRFYRVRDCAGFRLAVETLEADGLKACFKPSSGIFGQGFHTFDEAMTPMRRLLGGEPNRISRKEAFALLGQAGSFPELLVMEYLDGVEFSVDVLASEGEVVAMVCRRKPFQGNLRQKGTSATTWVSSGQSQVLAREPEIEGMVRLLARHFRLGGLFNVQFRSRAEIPECPHVLEINGRMSGGLPYIALSGLNLPVLAVKQALRHPFAVPEPMLPIRVQERSEVFVATPRP